MAKLTKEQRAELRAALAEIESGRAYLWAVVRQHDPIEPSDIDTGDISSAIDRLTDFLIHN